MNAIQELLDYIYTGATDLGLSERRLKEFEESLLGRLREDSAITNRGTYVSQAKSGIYSPGKRANSTTELTYALKRALLLGKLPPNLIGNIFNYVRNTEAESTIRAGLGMGGDMGLTGGKLISPKMGANVFSPSSRLNAYNGMYRTFDDQDNLNQMFLYPTPIGETYSLANVSVHELTHNLQETYSSRNTSKIEDEYSQYSQTLYDALNSFSDDLGISRHSTENLEYLTSPNEIMSRDVSSFLIEGRSLFQDTTKSIVERLTSSGYINRPRIDRLIKKLQQLDLEYLNFYRKIRKDSPLGTMFPARLDEYARAPRFRLLNLGEVSSKLPTPNLPPSILKNIRRFGSGGKLKKGSVGIVGERGPEIFSIDDEGAEIIPLDKLGLNLENTLGKVPGYASGTNTNDPGMQGLFDYLTNIIKMSKIGAIRFVKTMLTDSDVQKLKGDIASGKAPKASDFYGYLGLPQPQIVQPQFQQTSINTGTTSTIPKGAALREQARIETFSNVVARSPQNLGILSGIYNKATGQQPIGGVTPDVTAINFTKFQRVADAGRGIDKLLVSFEGANKALVNLELAISQKTGKILMANKESPLEVPEYNRRVRKSERKREVKQKEQARLVETAETNLENIVGWGMNIPEQEQRDILLNAMPKGINLQKSTFYPATKDQYGMTTLKADIVTLTGAHEKFSAVIDQENKVVVDATGKILKENEARKYRASQTKEETQELSGQQIFDKQRKEYTPEDPEVFKRAEQLDPRFLTDPSRKMSVLKRAGGYKDYKLSFEDEFGTIQKAEYAVDKYHNIIDRSRRSTMNFTDSIKRNMGEFFKWSLALSIVYAPLQKLGELYTAMITNQTKLAQTIVTLGVTQASTSKIFEDAATIAAATGTTVEGVLEGYNLAFRATADVTDQAEKFAVANKLMNDSITLSKLGMISQADATDVLVAALKQSDMKLSDGSILLDKWVTVSRNANVDVNTLATSFAIVGEAAANAGLDVDELNGIIATVAAKTITSAKETGNAVRALVSGYSTDASAKELMKFGIAVTDVQGKARGMMDVFTDIKASVQSGLISKTQLNDIALTIGGGNRRQAQAVLSIMGVQESQNVAQVSKNFEQGAAQKALDIITETIQVKLNTVNVEFTRLAQVLGTEGGILSSLSSLIDLFTVFAKGLTTITSTLGNASTVLLAMGIGKLALGKGQFGGALSEKVFNVVEKASYPLIRMGAEQLPGAASMSAAQITAASRTTSRELATNASLGMMRWAPLIGAVIGAGFTTYLRGQESGLDDAGKVIQGSVIGGLAGALASVFAGPAAPAVLPWAIAIGTTIGSAFGEAAAQESEKLRKTAQAGLQGEIPIKGQPNYYQYYTNPVTETKPIITGQEKNLAAMAAFGPGYVNRTEEQLKAGTSYTEEVITKLIKEYETWMQKPENAAANKNLMLSFKQAAEALAIAPVNKSGNKEIRWGEAFKTEVKPYMNTQLSGGMWANYGGMATPQVIGQIPITTQEEWNIAVEKLNKQTEPIKYSNYQKKINEFGKMNQIIYEEIFNTQMEWIKDQYDLGNITARVVKESREAARASLSFVSEVGAAFKFDPSALNGPNGLNIKNTKDLMEILTKINVRGSEDERTMITQLAATLKYRTVRMEQNVTKIDEEEWVDTGAINESTKKPIMEKLSDYKKATEDFQTDFIELLINTFKDIVNRTPVAPEMDFSKEGYSKETIGTIFEDTKKSVQTQYESMIAAGEPEQAAAFLNMNKKSEFWVIYKDGTRELYKGVLPEQMQEQVSVAKTSGLLKPTTLTNWGITKAQYETNFERTYAQIANEIKTVNPQFNFQDESMLVYTKDNQLIEVSHKDSRVISETLKRIEELEQKQLDGMFNLPEGASFYIPYQAARMHKDTESVVTSSQAMTGADSAFNAMMQKFREWEAYIESLKTPLVSPMQAFHETEAKYLSYQFETPEWKKEEYRTGEEDKRSEFSKYKIYDIEGLEERDPYINKTAPSIDYESMGILGSAIFSLNNILSSLNSRTVPTSQEAINKTTTQKFDFSIDNRVQLVVNGRVLAEVIKPYLYTSFQQYGSSATSSLSTSGSLIGI